MVRNGSHPLLRQAARRYCAAHRLEYAELSYGWVLRLGRGSKARFIHGFDLGLNTKLAAKAADDKYFAALIWREAGVPHVPRELLLSSELAERLRQSEADWRHATRAVLRTMSMKGEGGAVVLKPNEGRGGRDVFICADAEKAQARLHELFTRHETLCAEPYLPAERECRFVVLDGAVALAFAKVVEGAGDGNGLPRLHNLGREGHIAPLLPQEEALADMAVRAATALGLRFCTVDILSRGKAPLVLEANANVTLARAAEALGRERVLRIYKKALEKALSTN